MSGDHYGEQALSWEVHTELAEPDGQLYIWIGDHIPFRVPFYQYTEEQESCSESNILMSLQNQLSGEVEQGKAKEEEHKSNGTEANSLSHI